MLSVGLVDYCLINDTSSIGYILISNWDKNLQNSTIDEKMEELKLISQVSINGAHGIN